MGASLAAGQGRAVGRVPAGRKFGIMRDPVPRSCTAIRYRDPVPSSCAAFFVAVHRIKCRDFRLGNEQHIAHDAHFVFENR